MEPNNQQEPTQNFGGVPTGPANQKNNKNRLYVIGGIAAVVVVGLASFVFLTGSDTNLSTNETSQVASSQEVEVLNPASLDETITQGSNILSEAGLDVSNDPTLAQFNPDQSAEEILAQNQEDVQDFEDAQITEYAFARFNGTDRFDTAARASAAAHPDASVVSKVVLVNGDSAIDMAIAANYASPTTTVLPVQQNNIPDSIKAEMQRIRDARGPVSFRVTLLGSSSSLDLQVRDQARAIAGASNANRVFGATRIDTAIEVSKDLNQPLTGTNRTVYVAGEDAPIDMLMAVNGTVSNPVLLVPENNTPGEALLDEIVRLNANNIITVGGETRISGNTKTGLIDTLAARSYEVEIFDFLRLTGVEGPTRSETAIAVNERSYRGRQDGVIISNGFSITDTLTAVNISRARGGLPIQLFNSIDAQTNGNGYSNDAPTDVKRMQSVAFFTIGGTGAISDGAMNSFLSEVFSQ